MCAATDVEKKRKRDGLFKGFYNTVQMPNFVVFHLFPVLSVPANDIRVTSGLAGEILGLSAGCAAKIGPAAMNLDVRYSRNETPPLRAQPKTTERINIHLS